ncbi:MAG: aminotransferase class IV [Sedimentisphaerales bacterium]|nr:aminotransferase class IV [Sedimentisphaerales bacterium]
MHRISVEAGKLAMEYRSKLGSLQVDHKSKKDLVTQADIAVEKYLVGEIKKAYPAHSIFGEESGAHSGNEYRWVIDPIDGTGSFVYGHPIFSVSIALEKAGTTILAAVNIPAQNELFEAELGKGATLNGKPIKVSACTDFGYAMLATGFACMRTNEEHNNLPYLQAILPKIQDLRRFGSAAADLCFVACGRLDGFWELNLHVYDVAAGILILTEAGGKVTDFQGRALAGEYGEIVATNSVLHEELTGITTAVRRKCLPFAYGPCELAMIDDKITPMDDAMISIHDRSVYFGDGVYEALRVCHGKIFAADRHFKRLENSLKSMEMLETTDLNVIKERVNRAITTSGLQEAMVYFQISRGQEQRKHSWTDGIKSRFLLTIKEFKGTGSTEVAAITQPDMRWKQCHIKSLNLLANVQARHAASKAGAYEAILVDGDGIVTEATSSSVMMIKGNTLFAPPLAANILPGVTRSLILEWAPQVGLEVRQESFSLVDLLKADEVLLSGTATEVKSVVKVDDKVIADGKQGKYAVILHKLLKAAHDQLA